MAKTLKTFKAKPKKAKEPVVMEPEFFAPAVTAEVPTLGLPAVKLLDQLEKVGYNELAAKLRELQRTDGVDALDPTMDRMASIEKHIDKLLQAEELDSAELQKLLKMTTDLYQARAKSLLLPYGTVSPRTALQGNKGVSGAVNVAIGIGTGVSPRPKS